MNLIQKLEQKKLATPPSWLANNCAYLSIVGSTAHGTSSDQSSDYDVMGFCIPPKHDVFPHLAGHISGFGSAPKPFQQYQQHHINDPSENNGTGREYDLTVYGIVKYFNLLMDNNPSVLDTLFTPQECVLHTTQVGNLVRDNRHLFLHKGCWAKFKGYGYSMLHKMRTKTPDLGSKRAELFDKFGFDVKYGTHVVRLLLEAEQVLVEGTIDMRRHSDQLKSIRRGEWTMDEVIQWASDKERQLEEAYTKCELPATADEKRIRGLLFRCLEIHYGSLDGVVSRPEADRLALQDIRKILDTVGV